MIGTKLFVYNIIIWLITSSKLLTRAEETLNNSQTGFNETQILKIFPGIKFSLTDSEIIVNVRMYDLVQGICSVLDLIYLEVLFLSPLVKIIRVSLFQTREYKLAKEKRK